MKYFVLLSLVFSTSLFAAGDSHGGGSVMDLAFPFANFVILMSLLIYKIKTPMRDFFNQQAKDVAYLFESAEQKDKDAQVRLETFQKKMANLEAEKKKINDQMKEEVVKFSNKTQVETAQYLERISKDVDQKIIHEKAMMFRSLQEELVDEVISKAKESIKSSDEKSKKVTENLISQIG